MRRSILVLILLIAFIGLLVGLGVTTIAYQLHYQPVSSEIAEGIRRVADSSPELRSLYESAMQDDVLTLTEANKIMATAEQAPPR